MIQFVVDKNGELIEITTRKTISKGLGKAAEAVINKMKKDLDFWTPGRQAGKNVKVRYTVPIKFRLE